jgi:alpha-tubulin suppressor-like RCC1 family protein
MEAKSTQISSAVHRRARVVQIALVVALLLAQAGLSDEAVFGWGDNASGQSSPPPGLDDVAALAAGRSHSLALTEDGQVRAWGANESGQTTVPAGLTNNVGIAVWGSSSLALRADGTVVAWGAVSTVPSGLTNAAAIAAGTAGALVLMRDGVVFAFDSQTISTPLLSNAVAISSGESFQLALRGDGTVKVWGDNQWGQLNVPPGLTGVVAVAAGGWHALALQSNGTVVVWGANNSGQAEVPRDLTNAVAIAAGGWHSLAITADGRVVAWGANWTGQSTVPMLTNIGAVTAGYEYSLAAVHSGPPIVVTQPADQTGYSGGTASMSVTTKGHRPMSFQWVHDGSPVMGGTNATLVLEELFSEQAGLYWVAISNALGGTVSGNANLTVADSVPIITDLTGSQVVTPGKTVRFAVKTSGSMPQTYQWEFGQTNLPAQTNAVLILESVHPSQSGGYRVVVSNRFGHSISADSVLQVQDRSTGIVVAWGENSSGQTNVPEGLADVVAVAGGQSHSLALRGDGKVVTWGSIPDVPTGMIEVMAISAGATHNLALQRDGTVAAWGANDWGQLSIPAGLSGVKSIAAGGWHNLALTTNGAVLGWGANNSAQIAMPLGLSNVVAVAAGGWHSLALKSDGHVVAWGLNDFGQANVPPDLADVAAIACGVNHSLAIHRDGSLVAWGRNEQGQCAVPLGLAPLTAVAAGESFSMGLTRDGSVVVWGAQAPAPIGVADASSIGAGWGHSLAVGFRAIGVVINGTLVHGDSFGCRGGDGEVRLVNPFGDTTMLYTLDGTDPASSGFLYEGPFTLRQDAYLQACAYSEDFSSFAYSGLVRLTMVPNVTATSDRGGYVDVYPAEGDYLSNSLAVVTAIPEAGWRFLEWRGDAATTNISTVLSMTRDQEVRAVFGTSLQTMTVGNGSIVVSPLSDFYPYGSTVRLTAVPRAGNYFAYWGSDVNGTNSFVEFTVTNPEPKIVAVFALLGGAPMDSLTTIPSGRGQALVSPSGNRFPHGSTVVIQAVAEPGQDFQGWSGGADGNQNPLTVTLTSNAVITANFTARPWLAGEARPEVLSQDGFRLYLTGEWRVGYRIDWSTNLTEWTPLTILTNRFGAAQYTDAAGTNQPMRFYRAAGL